jgi:hypothetical protein
MTTADKGNNSDSHSFQKNVYVRYEANEVAVKPDCIWINTYIYWVQSSD